MIAHVIDALAASEHISRIIISTDDPHIIDIIPEASQLRAEGRLSIVVAQANLVDSVDTALIDSGYPAIVTTADNALLTARDIDSFVDAARSDDAEIAIAFARRDDVLTAHPKGQIRFYKFSDGAYSNCNLFWLANKRVLTAVESFREGGSLRNILAVSCVHLECLTCSRFCYVSEASMMRCVFCHDALMSKSPRCSSRMVRLRLMSTTNVRALSQKNC